MDKKLTFILPIYKVEEYLPQCIDSILSQVGEECQIVLVDDGSPDNSGAICDSYAAKNTNIHVIHKQNGGLSSARNAGMEVAEGKYVLFVDSDDYIEAGSVAKILDWIDSTDADVGFMLSRKVYPDGSSEPLGENLIRDRIRGKSREDVLRFLAACPKFPASAWGKIYRREFLVDHDFHFPYDRRLSEDLQYSLDLFLQADKFDYLDFPYYCYRQNREGSICNTINAKYYFDSFLFVEESGERFGEDKKAKNEIAALALSFVAYEYAILIWQLVFLTGEDHKRAYELLQKYRWVLKYGKSRKSKLVHAVVSLLGIKAAAKVMDVYMRNR